MYINDKTLLNTIISLVKFRKATFRITVIPWYCTIISHESPLFTMVQYIIYSYGVWLNFYDENVVTH